MVSIKDNAFKLHKFTLICNEDVLVSRLQKDIDDGIREKAIIEKSLRRSPFYLQLDTIKIDMSDITPVQAAQAIYDYVYGAV